MRSKIIWTLICGIFATAPVCAARFPNAVEKSISFSGTELRTIADLFGIGAESQSVSVKLGRGDAWAVYLLKQDTKEKLWNDNEGSPTRINTIEFSNANSNRLSIGPFWLDLGTRAPAPKVGYFSFSSPFISDTSDPTDAWTALLSRAKKEAEWKSDSDLHYQRSFSLADGGELSIQVFAQKDYAKGTKGQIITITAKSK